MKPILFYAVCSGFTRGDAPSTTRQMEHLVLTVKHHDPAENATHQTLGIVTVDMAAALEAPGTSTQEWHPVSKGPGVKGGDSPQGRVHVKVLKARNLCSMLFRVGNQCEYQPTAKEHTGSRGRRRPSRMIGDQIVPNRAKVLQGVTKRIALLFVLCQ